VAYLGFVQHRVWMTSVLQWGKVWVGAPEAEAFL